MITIVYGAPGSGKTALMTRFAVDAMRKKENLAPAKKEIERLRAGGFDRLSTPKHMVFANYPIFLDRTGKTRSYIVEGNYFSLPSEGKLTMFIPPYAIVFLDEWQKFLDGRESGSRDPQMSRLYEIHRHNHYDIFGASQRHDIADKNVREIVGQVIEVREIASKVKDHIVERTTWTCRVFGSYAAADAYEKSGKALKNYSTEKYTYEGNIFRHYDSYNNSAAFYKDRYDQDFTLLECFLPGKTIEGIKEWNLIHDFENMKAILKKGSAKK